MEVGKAPHGKAQQGDLVRSLLSDFQTSDSAARWWRAVPVVSAEPISEDLWLDSDVVTDLSGWNGPVGSTQLRLQPLCRGDVAGVRGGSSSNSTCEVMGWAPSRLL
ncbi:hypothetical protein NDU88_000149 [Pleurodeles waltl]|uniref:Uncharacterized protein n=1 Tax=Pleurodeles waltl TaxID=8319 RepID=A0AAV7PZE1_PLEWA|nr:hypothetical protein NDU88_000149 [Pleurodeles waltl]